MRLVLLLFISAISFSTFAGPRVAKALKTDLKGPELTASLVEGFHFNEKAPNAVTADGQTLRPAAISAREIKFTGLPNPLKAGRAQFYICDDALTFCETESVALSAGKTGLSKPVAANANKGKVNQYGFIQDDFTKALALAKKKKQLVLIDFSARWCPSCVRLEAETFATKEFKAMTAGLVKLRIDADLFENGVVSEKYKIHGIPTQLVVTADGEEVSRVVDFQSMETFKAFFQSVKEHPVSLKELEDKAKEPALLLQLGQRLLAANRAEDGLKYLAQVQPPPPELTMAKVKAAEDRFTADKKQKGAYVQALQAAIAAEPGSTRSLPWRAALIEQLDTPDAKQKVKADGVALADRLLKDKALLLEAAKTDDNGEYVGLEPLMVGMYRADIIEAASTSDDEKLAAWREAAQTGKDLQLSPKRTGSGMRFLLVLIHAKMFDDADKWVKALIKEDPANPELKRRQLRVLVEQKKWPEAVDLARATLKKSYGRNEFWVAEVLAKTLIEAKRFAEAEKVISTYLAREESGWAGVKEERKALEDLRSKIPKT
jgi:thioredoxin-like negative regulator of GroEL